MNSAQPDGYLFASGLPRRAGRQRERIGQFMMMNQGHPTCRPSNVGKRFKTRICSTEARRLKVAEAERGS